MSGLLVGLLLAEVLVRVLPFEVLALENLQLDARIARYEPHPYLVYTPRPGWSDPGPPRSVSHNSLGFRGAEFTRDKPPGVFRIACLGESSTYGQGPTSDVTTWPAQLAEALRESSASRIEVINGGVPGWTSYESLGNLAFRVLDLQPDLVLVMHGFNDQRFWFRRGLRADNSHARIVWPTAPPSRVTRLLERSRLFLVLRRAFTDYGERRLLSWWTIKDFGDPGSRVSAMPPEGPLFFARNLESMAALCRQRGIGIAFALQGYLREDLDLAAEHDGMRATREAILELGDRLDVPVCDLDRDDVLPQDRAFFVDSVHLTDAGAERVAQAWAGFLLARGLIGD